jgi:hypothetical protein
MHTHCLSSSVFKYIIKRKNNKIKMKTLTLPRAFVPGIVRNLRATQSPAVD